MPQRPRTIIRVGQRLFTDDGSRGYVAQNSQGKRIYGPGEEFLVEWLDGTGGGYEGAEYYTLATLADEGIMFGRGVMPWAK